MEAPPPRRLRALSTLVALALSLALHVGLWLLTDASEGRTPPPRQEPIAFEVVEVEPPPPEPEPEPIPEPEPEEEPPPPPPRPPPQRVAEAPPPPPQPRPEPPPEDLPPPPPTAPPQEKAPPAPIRIGASLSSTTQSGTFAVGTGNTLYGKTAETASDPQEATPYAAEETRKAPFVPETQLSVLPRPLPCPEAPYSEEARREGIEGSVRLLLRIDEEGKVSEVKLLKGLGYGLDELAMRHIGKCRFRPALHEGRPVETEIRYSYRFILDW